MTQAPTPEHRIAAHIATCPLENIGGAARAAARRGIIDGTASMVAGRRAEGVEAMISLARGWGSDCKSRIFASGLHAAPPLAAWCNGAMMRALELDDCIDSLPVHPTAATLPAILAALDMRPANGADLLRALAIAQDLKIRFGLAIELNAMQSGRNNLFKVFAATAGVAALWRLSPETTMHALGLSASFAVGDGQCAIDGSMALRVQFGNVASGAIQSVLLAMAGVTGPVSWLTGRYGFFQAYEPRNDLSILLDGLGSRFEGERISIKPHSACRCCHTVIDLIRDLRDEVDIDAVGLSRMTITVSPEVYGLVGGPRETKIAPVSGAAAQFSLPFSAATAWQHGKMGLRQSDPASLVDPRTIATMEKIFVISDEGNRTDNVIGRTDLDVMFDNGQTIRRSSSRPTGAPDKPVTERDLRAKFEDCLAFGGLSVNHSTLDAFLADVRAIEDVTGAASLFDAFA